MKFLLLLLLTISISLAHAQQRTDKPFERKGFIFGTSMGASAVQLKFATKPTQTEVSASFPNFKIGTMISNRTALLVYLPGSIHTYKNEERERDRGFEGIIPSVQYWFKDRWWVMGGLGLGMDAPAFYDIKNEDERKFYFGYASIAGAGYEIWRKGKCAIDIQSRVHYGAITRPEGNSTGVAFSLLIGVNWY